MKTRTAVEETSRRATTLAKTTHHPSTIEIAPSDPRVEGTTPHGREIIRRKLYAMQKRMKEQQQAREDTATALSPHPL
ncbi:MAG: hypothetical protein JXQ71_03795 [Verrucomicrobia bacterium]|nr:hypothetical protein [Verrucomicrobiota bacterium]